MRIVHFHLTLQPRCRKVFTSLTHAFKYWLPAVGLPTSPPSAFLLSTYSVMTVFIMLDATGLWIPSFIGWILRLRCRFWSVSGSALQQKHPSRRIMQYHGLLVRPEVYLYSSLESLMVSSLMLVAHGLCSTAS